MAAKWTNIPPNWFDAANYEATRTLDARGWAIMLWVRQEYQEQLKILREKVANFAGARARLRTRAKQALWDTFFKDARLSNADLGPGIDLPSGLNLPRVTALDDFTDGVTRDPTILDQIIEFQVGSLGHRLLAIDPTTPDTTLKRAFEKWLTKLRESRPSPIQRRGPRSINSEISPSILAGWANHQVLAVHDLDFHTDLFEAPKLSYDALFSLLGPSVNSANPGNAEEWGRSARAAAKKALAATDALIAQVQVG